MYDETDSLGVRGEADETSSFEGEYNEEGCKGKKDELKRIEKKKCKSCCQKLQTNELWLLQ